MPRPIEPVGPICVATAAAVAEAVALGATAVTVDDGEAVVDGLGFTIPVVVAVGLETLVAVRVGIAVAVNVLVGLGTAVGVAEGKAVEVAVAFLAARGSAADAPVAGKRARTRPTAQSATILRGCENGERARLAGRREEIMMMSRFALHGLTRSHQAG